VKFSIIFDILNIYNIFFEKFSPTSLFKNKNIYKNCFRVNYINIKNINNILFSNTYILHYEKRNIIISNSKNINYY